jgi:ribosomal protein S18 acetylase RimI-like enzyme
MGAVIEDLNLNGHAPAGPSDLATVGHVNDLAYGNPDSRLERTLAPLPAGLLLAYKADHQGRAASVALALHHGEDCGISFVATAPYARRHGLASDVMARVALDARDAGLTTTSLQATELGEKLYRALGYRRVSDMQLWERRR